MIDIQMPTHCPFCNRKLTNDGWSDNDKWLGCYGKEACSAVFESYKAEPTEDEYKAFYDLYPPTMGEGYVFQSTIDQENIGRSSLRNGHDGEILISIDNYTEPTIEAIEAIINRMKKLLVFS